MGRSLFYLAGGLSQSEVRVDEVWEGGAGGDGDTGCFIFLVNDEC